MLELGPAAFAAAFAAGFVSFASPCVLPLVPGYLSFVSGVSIDELGSSRRRVVATTAAFVAGFGAIFVALGAGAAWFGDLLVSNRRPLEIAAGAFIVFAGLVFAGARLPIALLREKRLRPPRLGGPLAPLVTGIAFGLGWTPCVGPTLAAILALSAGGSSPVQGAILLGVYSLGLGIPFLLFGLGFTRSLAVMRVARRHARAVGVASGGVLIVFGVLLATGQLVRITAELARLGGLSI